MLVFFLLTLLLFNIGELVLSNIVNVELPSQFDECANRSSTARHQCILDVFDNRTDRIPLKKEDMKLILQQDCYWYPFKRVRRECRTLSQMERNELWDAIKALKKDTTSTHDEQCILFTMAQISLDGTDIILRLDDVMKIPPHTVMFTDKFLGNPWEIVKKGPFVYWKTIRGIPLKRDLVSKGSFITNEWIKKILAQESHSAISEPTVNEGFVFEKNHNFIHAAIGGRMNDFNTSSQEPAFWIHHSFIDSVWEKLKNIDGYSHYFTKNIYQYED
ncbi:TYR [Mytilus coruscus]|uniref:TYR n=1 Tax=Mytilus coruscus TaxID=42192 RepID=A0A6J8BZF0_MYTCO|nr:TYR [Mytilus coruscus]